jgi:hypothetical protein
VAEIYGEVGWPKRYPWKTLEDLRAAVEARGAEYLALDRAGDSIFPNMRRARWKPPLDLLVEFPHRVHPCCPHHRGQRMWRRRGSAYRAPEFPSFEDFGEGEFAAEGNRCVVL